MAGNWLHVARSLRRGRAVGCSGGRDVFPVCDGLRPAAIEGKPLGIRVNAVLPGAVDTPMLWHNPNVRAGIEHVDPAYVGRPEQIAAVIAFLASDEAAFVQGAAYVADGGRMDKL